MSNHQTRREFVWSATIAGGVLGAHWLMGCGGASAPGNSGAGGQARPMDMGLADGGITPPDSGAPDAALAPEGIDPDRPWWLQGNFAPVADEVFSDTLEVVGEIPAGLEGLYLRNGPNPDGVDSGHWFLGDGMVHGVRFGGGQARWYRNRYVNTAARGGPGQGEFAAHPANTSVLHHNGQILTLAETGWPYVVSPEDLSTSAIESFGGALQTAMTAHPKRDPVTGELLFFGYRWTEPYLVSHVVDASGQLVQSEIIDIPRPTMQHDFAITATRTLFFDLPVVFDLDVLGAGGAVPYAWQPEGGARIGVMPRRGASADVRWIDIATCFMFHVVTAFDDPMDPDVVVVEGCRMASFTFDPRSPDAELGLSQPWRWTINVATGSVSEAQISDRYMEFPRVDPRRMGLPHRYHYSVLLDVGDGSDALGVAGIRSLGLCRRDRHTQEIAEYRFAPRYRTDEATFVPASPDAEEGDGWLVSYVYDRARQTSALSIIDANDITEGPRALVYLPQRVPHGFHGDWIPLT